LTGIFARRARGVAGTVFKQHLPRWLQQDRGEKVPIVVGDPAYIDVLHWARQKQQRQALIITREKDNMKPTVIAHVPCCSASR
jgi:hypothetical protein